MKQRPHEEKMFQSLLHDLRMDGLRGFDLQFTARKYFATVKSIIRVLDKTFDNNSEKLELIKAMQGKINYEYYLHNHKRKPKIKTEFADFGGKNFRFAKAAVESK